MDKTIENVRVGPRVERVRHETRRRRLVVARTERLPANLIRIVLKGEELRGFTSLGFDDHIKVFFPAVHGTSAAAMRDFTPRHYDAKAGELWVDFYLHDAGPATAWAAQANVGQTLEIGGPRGSMVMGLEGIDAHVFIGDETALPAISRRLEELPPAMPVLVVAEIDPSSGSPSLPPRAAMDVVRVARNAHTESPAHDIIQTLRSLQFPPGRCFVWVAVESQAARSIRNYLRSERGMDKNWIKAAGYWQRGAAGEHERIDD